MNNIHQVNEHTTRVLDIFIKDKVAADKIVLEQYPTSKIISDF